MCVCVNRRNRLNSSHASDKGYYRIESSNANNAEDLSEKTSSPYPMRYARLPQTLEIGLVSAVFVRWQEIMVAIAQRLHIDNDISAENCGVA